METHVYCPVFILLLLYKTCTYILGEYCTHNVDFEHRLFVIVFILKLYREVLFPVSHMLKKLSINRHHIPTSKYLKQLHFTVFYYADIPVCLFKSKFT